MIGKLAKWFAVGKLIGWWRRRDDGQHRYLSTACLHGDHGYCAAKVGAQGEKRPAQCKFCEARCLCSCHRNGAGPPPGDGDGPETR